jgi:hypothetical protein
MFLFGIFPYLFSFKFYFGLEKLPLYIMERLVNSPQRTTSFLDRFFRDQEDKCPLHKYEVSLFDGSEWSSRRRRGIIGGRISAEKKDGRSRFSDWTLKMGTESSTGVPNLSGGFFRERISVYGKPLRLNRSLYFGSSSSQGRSISSGNVGQNNQNTVSYDFQSSMDDHSPINQKEPHS